jgi:hypothetical protein
MQSARSVCEEVFFDLKLRRDSGEIFVCRVCILSARSTRRSKLSLSLKAQEVERRVCQEGIRKSFEEDAECKCAPRQRFRFHLSEAQEE